MNEIIQAVVDNDFVVFNEKITDKMKLKYDQNVEKIKSNINKNIFDNLLKEEIDIKYHVVLKGGSIGERKINGVRDLKNQTVLDKDKDLTFNTKDEAKLKASRLNKLLSPGEKKYYGLRYIVAEIINDKFTGK